LANDTGVGTILIENNFNINKKGWCYRNKIIQGIMASLLNLILFDLLLIVSRSWRWLVIWSIR